MSLRSLLVMAVLLAGCAAAPPPTGQNAPPIPEVPPPITTDQGQAFNVTIRTESGAQILVDKLEIEWNQRKGIHAFFGFWPDQYHQYATVPFGDLSRIDFLGPMPPSLFDQAEIGRETSNMIYANAFYTRLYYWDGRQTDFYAVVPKFRGEKDLALWEMVMDNQALSVATIEFDR
jgi:hypothetical protein